MGGKGRAIWYVRFRGYRGTDPKVRLFKTFQLKGGRQMS